MYSKLQLNGPVQWQLYTIFDMTYSNPAQFEIIVDYFLSSSWLSYALQEGPVFIRLQEY